MSSRGSSPLMLSSSPYQRELDSRYARSKAQLCFAKREIPLSQLPVESCARFHRSMQNSMETSLVSAGDTSFFNGSWLVEPLPVCYFRSETEVDDVSTLESCRCRHQRRLLSSSLEELQSGSLRKVWHPTGSFDHSLYH